MAAITEIIQKVLERTNQDKVPWQTTADEDTFVAVIGNLSVSVSRERDSGLRRSYFVVFQILDEQGRVIERLSSRSMEESDARDELEELYDKAKRTALQIDSKLDELLTELTKDG